MFLILDCLTPPIVSVGIPDNIIGNPPYGDNDTITYTCSINYTLHGTIENVCTGAPHYNWSITGSDLPTCLRSKVVFACSLF